MAAPFIIVQTLDEFPVSRSARRMINSFDIRDAIQEYTESLQLSSFFIVPDNEDGVFPVVHIYLKFSLNVFPSLDPRLRLENDASVEQRPNDRPSEIWIKGTVEDLFHALVPETPDDMQQLDGILRIRVGVTEDTEGIKYIEDNALDTTIAIPRLIPGKTWITIDGTEPPLSGELPVEDVVSVTIDDSTTPDQLHIIFDTGSDEGLRLNQRVIIHYKYYPLPTPCVPCPEPEPI